MLAKSKGTEAGFYTVPTSELKDFSGLKTRKEALLEDSAGLYARNDPDSHDLTLVGICQGKLPRQVGLNLVQRIQAKIPKS